MGSGRGKPKVFSDHSPLGRAIYGLAKGLTFLGGALLLAVVVMVTISIIGRAFLWAGLRPIRGDYELASAGVALAVFAFLPWCHLERGHAVVSILTDRFGPRVNAWILAITDLMMLAAAAFIAWRLWFGMLDKFAYGETSLLLRMPMGWPYAAAFACTLAFVLIALYCLGRSLTGALRGAGGRP